MNKVAATGAILFFQNFLLGKIISLLVLRNESVNVGVCDFTSAKQLEEASSQEQVVELNDGNSINDVCERWRSRRRLWED